MQKEITQRARADYESGLYRPGCAVKKELKPGVEKLINESGARSFSGLIALLAANPEEAGRALAPLVRAGYEEAAAANPKAAAQRSMRRLAELTKGLTPAEIEAAVAAARSRKAS